ncbi:chaperonin 10-like protein [Phyllosticta citriasiana]|uniref:chaperonin 10-like protein n=1 Tax=Phyllosticta citriasiana TaxID=595635 RepID=UPI0030FDCEE2
MRAIALSRHSDATVFHSTTLPKPTASGHDLLVRVHATSVKPVDTKVRAGTYDDYQTTSYASSSTNNAKNPPQKNALAYFDRAPKPPDHVLGFDGAGVVDHVGEQAAERGWRVGDEVFYSSSPVRQGANAQWQLVDGRSVARKPSGLSWAERRRVRSSVAPDALVCRHTLPQEQTAHNLFRALLGVGSVATQIARRILRLPVVVTTASRPETTEFSRSMGATHVVNHREPLPPQVEALALPIPIKYVFITYRTEQYMDATAAICAPFGKCLTFVWELLGPKPWYGVDVESHGEILRRLASWVDEGKIESHLRETMPLTVEGVVRARQAVEASRVIGKVGLEIWQDGRAFM